MNSDAKTTRGPKVGGRANASARAPRAHLGFLFLASVLVAACSGKIVTVTDEEDDSSGGSGGMSSTGGTPGTGGDPMPTGGTPGTGGEEPYMDPECPDEEPPETKPECDPLDPYKDCPVGYGCYPYLEYPFGEGCGHATFGAVCIPAGVGEQGAFCDDTYCAPGFMCVVGATGGKRCGQICEPIRDHMCPPGLICGETDIQGYGVCF